MSNKFSRMGWLVLLSASVCLAQPPAQNPPQLDRFDASMLDKSKDPCVDFYQYSCSKWEATHPIPSDLSSVSTAFSSGTPLYLWNQTILRETMEKAAADPAAKGTEKQVGDYWKSCMNLDERAAQGKQWLAEALKPVDEMKNKQQLAKVLAHLQMRLAPGWEGSDNQTNTALIGFGPAQDLEDSSKVVAGFDQAGFVAALARLLSERRRALEEDSRSLQKAPGAYVPARRRHAGEGRQGSRRGV